MATKTITDYINWFSGTYQGPMPVTILDAQGNVLASIGGGTQYTDGAAAPTHPTGNEIVYNKAGTMTAVSDQNPLPTSATVNPPANQRVSAQSGDFVAGAIADLATLLLHRKVVAHMQSNIS